MEEYGLRKMQPEDVEPVVAIIEAHQEEDGRLSRRYYDGYFQDRRRFESAREENFVAIHSSSEVIAGVCGYGPDSMEWPGILWLRWFHVAKRHRRKGVGRAMMERILREARDLETRKVYVDTSSDSSYAAARRLYEGFGFRLEGCFVDYYEDEAV